MSNARRANNEGSIRQRKDGRWEGRATGGIDYRTGQKKRESVYGKTKAEVVEKLRQLEYDIHCKELIDPTSTTLVEWLNHWLEVYMRNNLKQSTYVSYLGYINKHFAPAFPKMKLKELTTGHLQDFYNYKLTEEELSPKTIANMNRCLHKALGQAVLEHHLTFNPCDAVVLPKREKPDIEVFTPEQQQRLISVSYQFRFGVFVRLALATGMRISELTGLMWEDINWAKQELTVNRTLSRLPKIDYDGVGNSTEIVIQTPKTKNSRRTIPLVSQMITELQQWRRIQMQEAAQAQGVYADSGMVITNPLGGYVEPRTLKDHYEQMLAASGISHFTFHATRHSFATRALERGMDAKTLSAILGHTSTTFTLDTYTHVLDQHKHDGMMLMEDMFDIPTNQHQTYPIIITAMADGYILNAVDFSDISVKSVNIEDGMRMIFTEITDKYSGMILPPPTSYENLSLNPNEYVMMLNI